MLCAAVHRPVPLELSFVGVSVEHFAARNNLMTEICYNKVGGWRVLVSCHLAVLVVSSDEHHQRTDAQASTCVQQLLWDSCRPLPPWGPLVT